MHWYWNHERSLLNDNWWPAFLLRIAGMVGVVALNLAVVKKLIYKNKNSSYPCSFIRVFKKYVREECE